MSTYSQTCTNCGRWFRGKTYRHYDGERRFCSGTCRQQHHRKRKKLERLQREVAALEAELG